MEFFVFFLFFSGLGWDGMGWDWTGLGLGLDSDLYSLLALYGHFLLLAKRVCVHPFLENRYGMFFSVVLGYDLSYSAIETIVSPLTPCHYRMR